MMLPRPEIAAAIGVLTRGFCCGCPANLEAAHALVELGVRLGLDAACDALKPTDIIVRHGVWPILVAAKADIRAVETASVLRSQHG